MKPSKSIIDSVKARLLNITRNEGKSHQVILLRYFQERFLFRLSRSNYRENFFLKGGALLYALDHKKSRVTKDLDFLGINISSANTAIINAIKEICQVTYLEDGIHFDIDSMEIGEIIKDNTYKGVRVEMMAYLDRTKQKIQIDIGFGDVISPQAVEMTYPVLLNLEAPHILAYSIESVIAEKFEAMISLGEINTRMKDFYDLYQLLLNYKLSDEALTQAIYLTFKKRNTRPTPNHSLFTESFATSPERLTYWEAWIKKMRFDKPPAFIDVMTVIKDRLLPIYEILGQKRD